MTKHTDYAVRLLLLLANRNPELVTIQEVARTYDISKNHLMKVAHRLVQENYVKSVRGRNGGLLLSRPPEQINIGELVRATEPTSVLIEGFQVETDGGVITPAGFNHVLGESLTAFMNVLDTYTLKDLMAQKK
ncbi:MAG: RrF2 family transcriptional regulator [Hyphomicrobiales bacterium]